MISGTAGYLTKQDKQVVATFMGGFNSGFTAGHEGTLCNLPDEFKPKVEVYQSFASQNFIGHMRFKTNGAVTVYANDGTNNGRPLFNVNVVYFVD